MFARIAMVGALVHGAAVVSAHADPSMADPDPDPGTRPDPAAEPAISGRRRAGAITLSIVPGALVRGLGSHVARHPHARNRLALLGGAGLTAVIVGGVPIAATNGSGKVVIPGVHLIAVGAGLVLATWWTDIWSAAGGARLGGGPRRLAPVAVELAATWRRDPFLGEHALIAPAAELRRGAWMARASGLASTGGTLGGRADLEARRWADPPRELARAPSSRHSGSWLALRGAVQLRGERDQGYALYTGELAVRARLDLGRLDAHAAGTFVELDQGLGLELADYDHGAADINTILLSRVAWGVYLPGAAGEVSVFYDHRRDQLAGGLPAGRADGFFGSCGAVAELVVAAGWVAIAQLEVGSSSLTTVGLRREVD